MNKENIVKRLRDEANNSAGLRSDHYLQQLFNEAADEIERLRAFVRDRVADRPTMLAAKAGYHARRICLEAEQLLREMDGEQ